MVGGLWLWFWDGGEGGGGSINCDAGVLLGDGGSKSPIVLLLRLLGWICWQLEVTKFLDLAK